MSVICIFILLIFSPALTSKVNLFMSLCSTNRNICFKLGNCCEEVHNATGSHYEEPEKVFSCSNRRDILPPDMETKSFKLSNEVGLYLIDKCSRDTSIINDDIKTNCLSTKYMTISHRIPVYQMDGLIYVNKFCALCNGVKVSEFLYPFGRLICSTNNTVDIEEYFKGNIDYCTLIYTVPRITLFDNFCHQNLQPDVCEADERCRSSSTRFTKLWCSEKNSENKVFRNRYCAMCRLKGRKSERKCHVVDADNVESISYFFPKLRMNKQENTGSSISRLIDFKMLLAKEEFDTDVKNMSANHTKVCANMSEREKKISFILNLAAITLSVLGLISLLIVYSLLRELRNLGGIFIMNFAASLLVALILLTLPTILENHLILESCITISFLKMLFFLSAFSWMTLIGIDLLRAFTRGGNLPASRTGRSLLAKYSRTAALGYGVPLLWSLCAIIVNELCDRNSLLTPRFDPSRFCWFDNGVALIFWFFAPICTAVLVNTILLSVIVFSICRTKRQAKLATGSASNFKDMFFLTFKMTAALGLTWLFVLVVEIATPVHYCWLKIVSGLLATLQGFFVSCGFLFTHKVKKVVKENTRKSTSTTTTTTSITTRQRKSTTTN